MAPIRLRGEPSIRSRQRGVAALALTMLLLFALILGVAYVNRNLVFEQRASANQYRSTQAFEAAEAGLEWSLARLNDNRPIGADCRPSADVGATSFRDRYFAWDPVGSTYSARTWNDAGTPRPLRPTCVRGAAGWICSCPADAAPVLVAPLDVGPAPAFVLRIDGSARAGVLRLVATGCSSLAGACAPVGGGDPADATARVEVLAGLVPALHTPPVAALTVRGAVAADAAPFGAHNADTRSGGVAIHAGGAVSAALARLSVPAGAAPETALAHDDAALAGLDPARFFATWFGLDKPGWANQPVARRIACDGDCTATLLAEIAGDAGPALIHVDGDLLLRGPATLGSAEHPVVVVASGAVRLEGAVRIDGLLYAAGLTWTLGGAGGGLVRGAVISEGDYAGDGTPQIVYDPAVLGRLRGNAGTFARVNGSWKDF